MERTSTDISYKKLSEVTQNEWQPSGSTGDVVTQCVAQVTVHFSADDSGLFAPDHMAVEQALNSHGLSGEGKDGFTSVAFETLPEDDATAATVLRNQLTSLGELGSSVSSDGKSSKIVGGKKLAIAFLSQPEASVADVEQLRNRLSDDEYRQLLRFAAPELAYEESL